MPEYLEDPSVLTKEKLKSELLANNVALPSGDQRKEVYVRLYLSSLTVQNQRSAPLMDAFSSDEELPAPVLGSSRSRSGRKATRKTDKPSPEEMDVTELTSEGLKDELLKYGVNAGPIVASTRKLYERKLLKLLDQGPPPLAVTPAAVTEIDSNHNGNSDSDRYSDKEEETPAPEPAPEPEPEPVPVPVVERPVRSRGKTPVTTRTRSSQHNRTNEQLFDEEEDDDDLGDLDEAQPVLNVKRKMRRTSFRADQTAAVRDETLSHKNHQDQSEWSAAEVAPALHTTPRHATPKGIPNDPRPLLADLPDKTSHLFHGSSKTKLPAQASPLSQTALLTQPKRKSLPLPKPKAPSQPWSTSAVSPEAVHMGRPHSPSYSPKGMQPPLQHTSEALLPCDTEGWAGLKPRGPSRRIHLHKPPQGHRAPDSTQVLPTWQPNWKPSEEDVNLPLTPFQTASPSPLSLLNTALIQDPDQSPDAPVGKITRPQRLAPYKVFPPEVSPLLVGPPSKLSAWPQTRGDPGAFCFSPVGQISSTPLPTQLSAHAGFAQFNSPDEPLSLDQHESTDVPLPKWRHSKIPLIQSSTVTPIRRRGAVSLPSKDPCLGEVEKIAAGDQTSRMDEGDILKEMYPNKVNTPTGINATCRQPIRGAAGRPLKSSDLWLENSLLHSPRETTSTSSFKESRVVHRVTSLSSPPPFSSSSSSFSSSSRLVSAAVAPPTVQPKARRGWSMWLQLLLLSVLAGFLFFVYQTMETNAMSPFGGSSSSSGSAQVGSDSTSK